MNLSLYSPGDSVMHRLGAGTKLAGLAGMGAALIWIDDLRVLAALALVCPLILLSCRLPRERVTRAIVWPLVIGLLVLLASLVISELRFGLISALRLIILMTLAAAVTMTTPTGAILALIGKGLSPFGRRGRLVSAYLGLAIGLVLRLIPEIAAEFDAIREAQAARGVKARPLPLVIPLVIRTLRNADDIAAALDARGFPPADLRRPDAVRDGYDARGG
ncbi:Energy-coupling factor transporter transmembrane protein BioN [Hartmannibacter diazotrophicus]|uniref:Energy-coupling factor transporter transmembrane protein BioN n=1 Tax=Hartmannibacter diazotrophicus TaxID=1482074 RepID=A0A2C9D2P3_9HYPH|nr:energy-coupling factor transporter transmembrane protein EcfT [Hartmannibacter diazotrophicus]SON54536.1 Energy-coupling factor transporter transmembrane protein BioN [Hartmannibacter diazotrophicus]